MLLSFHFILIWRYPCLCAVLGYRPTGVLLVALLSFNPLLALPKKKMLSAGSKQRTTAQGIKTPEILFGFGWVSLVLFFMSLPGTPKEMWR